MNIGGNTRSTTNLQRKNQQPERMRIAATADLHFTPQRYDSIREPMSRLKDEADVLIIAGDLTNFGKPEEMSSFLAALVRLRIPIVAVLGDHDYETGQH